MLSNAANVLSNPLFIEKTKLRLKKVFFLVAMWITAGSFFSVTQALGDKSVIQNAFTSVGLNKGAVLITILFSSTVVGVVTGIFEAFMFEKRYRKLHVGKLILYDALFYLALYFCLFTAGVFIYKKYFSVDKITISEFQKYVFSYFSSPHALLSFIVFGTFILFSLFLLHTRDKFGSNIMGKFLAGKYFFPREEIRIFMFLDIKSATTIAEKLGPLNYHQFLNDFYYEITYPILFKKGEIYQYVGDEITISWTERDGLKNSNCIECFFEIENTIKNASNKFIKKYGFVPDFKAGIHIGSTVAGEIGIIKREIVYSGDTLNTASRIQSLCNSFDEKLLISKEVLNRIKNRDKYFVGEIGEHELRGRKAKIYLFAIRKKN
jgi:adenylate cyclase